MEHLNREGQHRALYVNVEAGQAAREDVAHGMAAILYELGDRARRHLGDTFLAGIRAEVLAVAGPFAALGAALTRWAEASPQPTVLLVDEIDALVGDTLISVLRQLRAGYDTRPAHFPSTVILCGARCAGLPHPVESGQGDHHRRQRIQPFDRLRAGYQGRVTAVG
jgi:hypothetical protein